MCQDLLADLVWDTGHIVDAHEALSARQLIQSLEAINLEPGPAFPGALSLAIGTTQAIAMPLGPEGCGH